jgi:glutathione S-transferase
MTDEVVLYYNPMSRARIAHWMLEEAGAPYRLELVNLQKGENKQPAFLAVNPMGKLPAIAHRGVVVTESPAICAYLADAFPSAGLAPALTSPERGTYYRWFFFGAGCVDPAMLDKMTGRPPSPRPTANGYGCYEDTMNALEKALSPGPYILGERFSAVDVYIGSQIRFGMLMTKTLEPRPAFTAYLQRLADRPASKRVEEQSQQQMAKLAANA